MAVTKKRKLDDDDAQSDAISDGAVGRTGRLKDYIASRHCGVSEAQLRIEFEEWVLRGCLTYAEIDEGRVPRTEDLQECTEAYAVLGAQGVKQENSMDAHNIAATSISGDTDESKTAMQKLIVGSKPSQDLVKVEDMSN
ncbi:hypothetical protein LTR09_012591 [Extremus antarcticus]|uniref:Uncharacterized protein n=1 Tax=Extremus antarcticus TaxID=702011 RepID=A0AAJ0G4A5_9PEZI|nr:hypothetical protein LTR09_012591 [Extremus antarcticus]